MPTINTITGQLARINSAANTIWNKASDMALRLPAGSYWDLISKSDKTITGVNLITGLDSPEAEYKIDSNGSTETYNFGIDAVAQAIKNINSKEYLGQNSDGIYISRDLMLPDKLLLLINAKTTIKIPVGYNKNAFEITAQSIGSQLEPTSAIAKYLYKDKTAYIKISDKEHRLIRGELSTVYLNAALGEYNENKINLNNRTLKVSINSDAINDYLDTNISYRDPENDDDVARTGSVTRDNKTYLAVDLLKGYYDKNIVTDIAYISGTLYRTVEISRYKTPDNETTDVVNTLQIPAGYYEGGLVITPIFKDLGDNEEKVLNITNLLLANNTILNFTSGSAIIDPRNYNGSYDYFGYVVIPKAVVSFENGQGKVTASGWVNKGDKFINAYTTLTAGQVNVSDDWDATDKVITDRIFNIKVDLGYYSETAVTKEFTIKAGSHNLSVNFYNDNKFGGSTAITSGIENITKQYGKITDTIAAGWINGSSSNKYYRILDWGRISNTPKTEGYYTVGTSGWISSNSEFKYVGNNINSGGIYNPVKAGANLTIPAGTVLTNDLTVNKISVGEAEYVITKADLANTDGNTKPTKFTVEADSGYMTKITIDMLEILNELQKI